MTPETTRELVENRSKNAQITPCEKVLGNLSRVGEIANYWEMNANLQNLIATNSILEYIKEGGHSSEQIDAYMRGVGDIGKFMAECAQERIKLQEENLKKGI
jgi:hypothetical protein